MAGRKTKREEIKDVELHKKASSYLCDNFHKFNEDKKLEIALKLVQKFGITTVANDITVNDLSESESNELLKIADRFISISNN